MIQIDSLSKFYPKNSNPALQNVNLTICEGDIFGLIGQSGAGKSSLIRCLARLIQPTSGAIFVNGRNIAFNEGQELREYRKNIGMIFQHFNLLTSRTVAKNVAFPLEIAGKEDLTRVDELLDLVGLGAKKNAFPLQLSGGEQQRVGIARALATKPKILLCDEATSALDPKSTKDILDLLKEVNASYKVTIFLITHEMEVIRRICNKVAVMDRGQIVEQGLVSDIFFNPKESITKSFLQNTTHEIPAEFFKAISPERRLLRLIFKGKAAGEPHISHLIQNFEVQANILLGWIDNLQTITIGNLVIELIGSSEKIEKALVYLKDQGVICEELKNEF